MTTFNLLEENIDQRPDNGWLHGVVIAFGFDGVNKTLVNSSNPLPVDTELPAAAALADSDGNPNTPKIGSCGLLWDGTYWNRATGNLPLSLLTSAARTATVASALQTNRNGKGLKLYVNVTNGSGFSLTPQILARMPVSAAADGGIWAASAAITTLGLKIYELYPGATSAAANAVIERLSLLIDYSWYFNMVHGNSNSVTYAVEAVLF